MGNRVWGRWGLAVAFLVAIPAAQAQVRYGAQGSSGLLSISRPPPAAPLEHAWGYNPSWYYGQRHPPGFSGYYPGYYSYSGYTGPSQSRDRPAYFRLPTGLDAGLPPAGAGARSPLPPPPSERGPASRGEMTHPDGRVSVEVRVPPGAEVWIEGARMQQTGEARRFVSPPLAPGLYTWDLRARWTEGGREVTRARRLPVLAGYHYQVDFTEPPGAASGGDAGRD